MAIRKSSDRLNVVCAHVTVKPFHLAALKVGDFACKIILAPFIFSELKPYNSKYGSNFILFFGLQLIFAPFNFVVLFGSRSSRNKGHADIKGFTVIYYCCKFLGSCDTFSDVQSLKSSRLNVICY